MLNRSSKEVFYKLFPMIYKLFSRNAIYSYKFFKTGSSSYFHYCNKVVNPQYISIGNSVTIEKDAWLNVIVNEKTHGFIEIQKNANLGMRITLSSANKITIRENVLIGINVYIADHQHAYDDIHTPIMWQGIKGIGTIIVNDGAWIGNNVVILASKNITIGKNAVIGANSVVKDSIPDFSVAVGNPARVIKVYDKKLKKWIKHT